MNLAMANGVRNENYKAPEDKTKVTKYDHFPKGMKHDIHTTLEEE